MKITDKMRLDFLGTRYFTVRCDAIDDTLMAIWGNTIGPEVKP